MPNILYDAVFDRLSRRQGPLLHLADGSHLSGNDFHRMVSRAAAAL